MSKCRRSMGGGAALAAGDSDGDGWDSAHGVAMARGGVGERRRRGTLGLGAVG